MEKKYQVFISSTYVDLVEERKKVLNMLLMADCIPAGMEAFVATDMAQFEVIKKVIDLCDYYVLIIGKRYGSINETTGLSYTEMEYDYAISKGIPVLVFAMDDSVDVPENKKETDLHKQVKLIDFRNKALNNRLATMWRTDDELLSNLAIAIMKAKNEISRPGWQRGTEYDEASLRREIMKLQEDNKNLRETLGKKEKIIESFEKQEDLAFDNQAIDIPYTYQSYSPYGGRYEQEGVLQTDLKTIFVIIATEMMNTAIVEYRAKEALEEELPFSGEATISDKHFIKRMLNQFKALLLMDAQVNPKDNYVYWSLTSKGERVRDDEILIKKNE